MDQSAQSELRYLKAPHPTPATLDPEQAREALDVVAASSA
jgi:hypothetical protein